MGRGSLSSDATWASEPIAIIGLSCKFAGEASSPEKLWKLLSRGGSAWSSIPDSRFNAKGAYHPNHEKIATTHVRGGYFLDEDIGLFDAAFFNFSAETASTLDPQFRLQLESVYEALENAGLSLSQVAGSNTSVFAGIFAHDYRDSIVRDEDNLPRFFLTGIGSAMASNRISHFFDLRGASMTIDTGCSTTLVALHQAVQSLRSGESDMSIVGGSNILLNPDHFKALGTLGFLSPDGKCFAFDLRANGYGRGDGVATIVIKRLRDAVAAGDPIRAVIRETHLNQDGKTETLTSPSQTAQEALMRECYSRAGIDPLDTQYFEAHGTGTPTGDPIEAGAVAAIFKGKQRPYDKALRIGSIKTSIGHTEATSGLASIIKVVLAMERGMIPPTINFKNPNPKLKLDQWNLKVATALEDWPTGPNSIRRASINNFGYGGSNAHVIMEYEAPPHLVLDGNIGNGGVQDATRLLVLSAKDEQACKNTVSNLKGFLREQSQIGIEDVTTFLQRLVYTLGQRRSLFSWIAANPVPFSQGIDAVINSLDTPKFRPSRTPRRPRIGMVFTGQGAQWHAMGRELIEGYPIFKESLLEADGYLKQLGATWSLMEELHRDAKTTRVNETGFSIPLCVALQISLVKLLRTWGITPNAVTSHSSGEIAAAYAVGAISYRKAMGIAYYRSVLAAEMTVTAPVKGAMIAVGLGSEESKRYLERLRCNATATVACINSPSSTTVAGDLAAIEELESLLVVDSVFARRLRVSTAYHSHHMNTIAEEYYKALSSMSDDNDIDLDSLDSISFSSPVTGYRISTAQVLASPDHWIESLLQPVQFVDAFTEMVLGDFDVDLETSASSVDLIVEIGPHTALGGPIKEILLLPDFDGIKLPYYGSLLRHANAMDSLQTLAANLIREGYLLNLEAINFPNGRSKRVQVLTNLPSYSWNHQTRHWAEPRTNKGMRERAQAPHDLLGLLVPGANLEMPTWRHIIRISESPWLNDHVIQSNILYPGSGFVCLAIEAIRQQVEIVKQGDTKTENEILGYQLRDVEILQALVIPDTTEGIEIQTNLRPTSDKAISVRDCKHFEIFSVTADNQWTKHAHGLVSIKFEDGNGTPNRGTHGDQKKKHNLDPSTDYARRIDPKDMWTVLESVGIRYGPKFKNIKSIVQSGREPRSVSTITVPDTSIPKELPPTHVLHPTTLESAIQCTYTALPNTDSRQESPRVLQSIEKLWVSNKIRREAGHHMQCHTFLRRADAQGIVADISAVDHEVDDSNTTIEISGIVLKSLGRNTIKNEKKSWDNELCSKVEWACAPDMSLTSLTGLDAAIKTKLSCPLDEGQRKGVKDLWKACIYFIQDALDAVSENGATHLSGHYCRLHVWMQEQVQKAISGKLGAGPESAEWLKDDVSSRQHHIRLIAQAGVGGEMLCCLGPHLTNILQGEVSPMTLMMESNLLKKYQSSGLDRSVAHAASLLHQMIHKNPRARVLEVGGNAGSVTRCMFKSLSDSETTKATGLLAASYHITSISSDDFGAARQDLTQWSDVTVFSTFDTNQDLSIQGFELKSYDVVIANQVQMMNKSSEDILKQLYSLLKLGGKLLLVEMTRDTLDRQLIFGVLSEWWETAKFGPYSLSQSVPSWDQILKRSGFSGVDIEIGDCESEDMRTTSTIIATAPTNSYLTQPLPEEIIIVNNKDGESPSHEWLEALRTSISKNSTHPRSPPTVYSLDSLAETGTTFHSNKICVFISEMQEPFLHNIDSTTFETIKAMAIGCKGLLWVTRGGAIECANPDQALAVGFLRSLRNEYLGRSYFILDLDPNAQLWSDENVSAIVQVLRAGFSSPSSDDLGPLTNEFEFAVRDGMFMIPRLVKDTSRNQMLSSKDIDDLDLSKAINLEPLHQPDRPLSLHIGVPGLLDTLTFNDNPSIHANDSYSIASDMIEIDPRAYGVNFRDIMAAMGQLHEQAMGFECAGVITHLGSQAAAQGFSVGDRVACLLTGNFGGRAFVHWKYTIHMPLDLSFEEATSLPVAFSTAYITLIDMARLERGQTILIHSAAGAVGQAAIMIGKHLGAEMFVTASTAEKRNMLMNKYGIPGDRIFNSRDASFAAGILSHTEGRGVDVVINSLAGPLLQESLNIVAPFGQFIELGKRDLEMNSHLEMRSFNRQITFSAFDLLVLIKHKPGTIKKALAEAARLLELKAITPIHPITTYRMGDVSKAFRLLQSGKHMGKIVLSATPDETVPVLQRTLSPRFKSDASYLIVGGLGGIGRSIAYWMVSNGAKNLILLSRSAGASRNTAAYLEELRETGCQVKVVGCDVANDKSLSNALQSCEKEGLPPIRGVIQAAMVLQDTILEQMTHANYEAAVLPKVRGTWNLHKYFESRDSLDFFVILSSAVGITGNASQSNYSAAGSYQDALARWRVTHGLPAVSIDLGAVKAIGVAAETAGILGRLRRLGHKPISEEQVLGVLGSAILAPYDPQIIVGLDSGPGSHWDVDGESQLGRDARFSAIRSDSKQGNTDSKSDEDTSNSLASRLAAAGSMEKAIELVGTAITEKLSDIFMIPVSDIELTNRPAHYGIDSLVAVELRNMLVQQAAADVSIFSIIQSPSLAALAANVAAKSAHVGS